MVYVIAGLLLVHGLIHAVGIATTRPATDARPRVPGADDGLPYVEVAT